MKAIFASRRTKYGEGCQYPPLYLRAVTDIVQIVGDIARLELVVARSPKPRVVDVVDGR